MDTFTKSPIATTVAGGTPLDINRAITSSSPRASSIPDEDLDPNCTPPSSPNKTVLPSTPKSTPRSTPLHRRFLQEVTMSPATPPRTPSRDKRDSPMKGRETPAKGRESPSKQKLEIGQNGFYFSCELSKSKVTPKKTGTPKKDVGEEIPARRTPSPTKSAKQSPARVLFSTTPRKTGTPNGSRGGGTPVKRAVGSNGSSKKSIKVAPRFAQDLSSTPTSTLRIPPECLKDVSEEEAGSEAPATKISTDKAPPSKQQTRNKSSPSDIGYMMAGLSAGTFKTHDWAHAGHTSEKKVSPAPTPLRRASEKLNLKASPSFLRLSANGGIAVTNGSPENYLNRTQPLRALSTSPNRYRPNEDTLSNSASSKAAGEVSSTDITTVRKADQDLTTTDSLTVQPARSLHKSTVQIPTALDVMKKDQPPQYPPSQLPKPELEPEPTKDGLSQGPDKHVQWQDNGTPRPKSIRRQPMSQQRRVGTDPSVLLSMKKEMVKVEAAMRRSVGPEYTFRGTPNTNDLPAMSSTLSTKEQEASGPDVIGIPAGRRTSSRTNSSTSSTSTIKASMVTSTKQRDSTPTAPSASHWRPNSITPAQARRERIAAAKQADMNRWHAGMASSPRTPAARPMSATSKGSAKATTATVTTPKQPKTSSATNTPSRPQLRDGAVRPTPTSTPVENKTGASTIPRSARKSVFDSPAPVPVTPVSKPPITAQKSLYTTPRPATARKPARPAPPKPYDPSKDPRPYEKKFASATDIADRIAEWHSEDRKKAASKPSVPTRIQKTPRKTAVSDASKKDKEKESYTPEGSPTRLPSPAKNRTLRPTHAEPATKSPAPRTPASKKTAATRMRDRGALRTPKPSRIGVLDKNALRTPSKAIVSSLDKAIDAKIAEEVKSGREFTPSGNRIRDLLEARGRDGEKT